MTTLYKKDKKGILRFWEIDALDDGYETTFGTVGGEEQTKFHPIDEGKGGREQDEQIESRVEARIRAQIDKRGYFESREEALNATKELNELGFLKPMLAAPIPKIRSKMRQGKWFVQRKYNGHRCLILKSEDGIVAYSRGGKIINSIDHILESAREILESYEVGTTLDGELYHHGTPLQTISSWVRRKQEKSKELSFMLYDCIIDGMPYEERLNEIRSMYEGEGIVKVETWTYSEDVLKDQHDIAVRKGYEGLMLRHAAALYEDAKRSKFLLKVKERLDMEFEVVDILKSVDGWARLECVTPHGHTFKCSAPGDIAQKTEVLKNKEKYIGKKVNVEFVGWTKARKPEQPVAICWEWEKAL